MKLKLLSAMVLGAALSMSAQGYKDGIQYYKAGQYDNAITLLQRNLNGADTDKALSQYYLGQAYLVKGDKTAAQTAFQAGVAANAECPYNYVGLGALQLLNGDANGAKENFKQAQKFGKKNSEVLVDIARAYYNADPERYAKEIAEYVAKAHKQSKDKEPSIYVFVGVGLAKAKDWNAAATQYEQAILFDEDNPEGYVKYANVYFNISPEYAINRLEELLQKQPTSALAQRELAEKYYLHGKWTRAAQQYGKYIQNPNHFPEDKARYAVLLYAGQNYKDAADVSREVLSRDPNNFQAERVLVRSLSDLKDPSALAAAEKFFGNPDFKGRYNAADYSNYASLLKQDTVNAAKVLPVLEAGLAAFPENSSLLYDLSDYWFDKKDYPKAADYIEKYVNAEENPSRSDLYAAALNFLGATSSVADDDARRQDYGNRGVALMDRAMEGLDLGQTPPQYIRRKALIEQIRNKSVTDAASLADWQKLIQRLDMNPEYADPNNEKNLLSYYVDAYRAIAQYEAVNQNTEAMNAAKEKQAYYAGLEAKAPKN